MSFSRLGLLAISLTSAAGGALASSVTCPQALFGKPLSTTDVYDGPVMEMTSLVPFNGGWRLGYRSSSKEGFYLACWYGDTILSVLLATDVNGCWFTTNMNVVCNENTQPYRASPQ